MPLIQKLPPAAAPKAAATLVRYKVAATTKLALIAAVACGLMLDCFDWTQPIPVLQPWKFSFYTIQSNTVLGAYHLVELCRRDALWEPKGSEARAASRKAVQREILKLVMLMMITVTGVVWHVVLREPMIVAQYPWNVKIGSTLLHTATPMLAWFDWVLCGNREVSLRKRYVPFFLICPLLYLAFSFARAHLGGALGVDPNTGRPFYHWYRFIDAGHVARLFPWAGVDHRPDLVVAVNCLVIAFAITLGSFLLVFCDRLLKN